MAFVEPGRDLDRLVLSGDDSSQLNKLKFSGVDGIGTFESAGNCRKGAAFFIRIIS